MEEACQQSWQGDLLWLNPHCNLMEQVVEKIAHDKAHGILVIIDWPHRTSHCKSLALMTDDILILSHTRLFSLQSTVCKGTLWNTRVIFFVATLQSAHLLWITSLWLLMHFLRFLFPPLHLWSTSMRLKTIPWIPQFPISTPPLQLLPLYL